MLWKKVDPNAPEQVVNNGEVECEAPCPYPTRFRYVSIASPFITTPMIMHTTKL